MTGAAFIPIGVDPPTVLSEQCRAQLNARSDLSASTLLDLLLASRMQINRVTAPEVSEQLRHSATRPIDTVVCAVLDADPRASLNAAVARAFALDVQSGVRCVAKAVGAQRSMIVADSSLSLPALAGRRAGDDPKLVTFEHAYPQLHPTLLLARLLQRRLAPGRLPVEAGVIVIDAAAAWTIARLLAGDVSIAVPMCIRDQRTDRTTFAAVAPEVSLEEVLTALQVPRPGEQDRAFGGELILHRPADLKQPAGLASPVVHICPCPVQFASDPCVRCNWCADVCPTGVLPMIALEAAQFADQSLIDRSGAQWCIECGLCDYVCPSTLPLVAATINARNLGVLSPADEPG